MQGGRLPCAWHVEDVDAGVFEIDSGADAVNAGCMVAVAVLVRVERRTDSHKAGTKCFVNGAGVIRKSDGGDGRI